MSNYRTKHMAKIDVAFVACSNPGNPSHKIDKSISQVSRHLTTVNQDCRIASIHFKQDYNAGVGKQLFSSNVSDFSNVYRDGKSNEGNPLLYGYPLQHVANLSFRHDATKICFLISNILPFNDSCEETIIYKNELNCDTSNNETSQQNNTNTDDGSSQNYTNDWGSPSNTNDWGSLSNKDNRTIITDQQQSHKTNTSTPSQTNSNIVYHEDPLQSCRIMAAMGVVLYSIETMPNSMIYKDIHDALCHITGGQYLNIHQSQLAKAIKAAILEEVSQEHLVVCARDYLCIAWLAWGRMKAKKPSNLEELTQNVLNYFHKVNIIRQEILIDKKPLKPPSKHSKKLTRLNSIAEARRVKDLEDNWTAEVSWVKPEVCNEVIPGYETPVENNSQKPKIKIFMVTVSAPKRISRTQVERVVVRALARRTVMVRQQELPLGVQKRCSNINRITEKTQDTDSNPVLEVQNGNTVDQQCTENVKIFRDDRDIVSTTEKDIESGTNHQEKLLIVSCKQELISEKLTEKCTLVTCKNCVLV